MHILHFVYPFIPRWTLELLPPFTYCECCCHEPWHTESVQVPVSSSLGHIPRSRTTRLYGNSVFNFLSACVQARSISHVQLFVTSQTVARQTPLSIGFSRQEYGSGLPFPTPRDLPGPGVEPMSSALAGRFFTTVPHGKPT